MTSTSCDMIFFFFWYICTQALFFGNQLFIVIVYLVYSYLVRALFFFNEGNSRKKVLFFWRLCRKTSLTGELEKKNFCIKTIIPLTDFPLFYCTNILINLTTVGVLWNHYIKAAQDDGILFHCLVFQDIRCWSCLQWQLN